jgi:hypothetical protein
VAGEFPLGMSRNLGDFRHRLYADLCLDARAAEFHRALADAEVHRALFVQRAAQDMIENFAFAFTQLRKSGLCILGFRARRTLRFIGCCIKSKLLNKEVLRVISSCRSSLCESFKPSCIVSFLCLGR